MKPFYYLTTLRGLLFLSGCAGTQSDFQCHSTTRDNCMTMEQANEKAKGYDVSQPIKPMALRLPTLAEGDVRASSAPIKTTATSLLKTRWITSPSHNKKSITPITPSATRLTRASITSHVAASTPLRIVDQTARLWIAPYIDNQDVYHHDGWVEFVVTSSHWESARMN